MAIYVLEGKSYTERMGRAFAELTFTPTVRAVQEQMGSRRAYQKMEEHGAPNDRITADIAAFIEERDSFYQASVAENGWPYVQHRGGPVGFLRVLDDKTLTYPDFRGNRQYLSVGNLTSDDRVMLFLMDYPNQARLKIWGRARFADPTTSPGHVVERDVLITVEAYDWNCSQHITPRFTREELGIDVTSVTE